ncbi:MAG: PBP1A family penicillin-binding protein [Alphaproteobacteria bacterium]|nr:PBP1A family penicillin-binding protein [Alphaproteobacteria bacterium]
MVRLGLMLLLWSVILGSGIIGYFALTLPDTTQLAQSQRRPSVTILAADGRLLATYGDLFGRPLTLREMSRYLPEAVIATEDRRFYHHFGIDPFGLVRAALADLAARRVVEGGSTITQQLAKNLFLTPERSFARKIREVLLALWLEHRFAKNQILEIYLNRVYLGAGTYGVDAAAHRYFSRSVSRLDLYQSAMIAGLLKAPARFNPTRDRALAAERTAQVLSNMVEAGYITPSQAAAAERSEERALADVAVSRPGNRYFADWIAAQLVDFVGPNSRDLRVVTTLDPRLQAEAEAAIGAALGRDGARDAVSQGALVAMSPDGAVRAMVGGRSYDASQFNRATQAQRQPGSAFKPFVYLAGLEAGLTPIDHFVDRPLAIGSWRPRDFGNRYLGDMTMAEALAQSVNTIAVQVALRAGIDNVAAVAHRLGIASPMTRDPSIALGTDDVNLLELTSAYVPFANGGMGVWAYGVTEVRDSRGNVLFRRTGSGPGRVISPECETEMNQMLAAVIDHGTGRSAQLPRPAAGKTGTTQDDRDAWFIGYTADLVTGVWFGNDDNTPMNNVIGGGLPAQTWRNFMLAATRLMPIRPLPSAQPSGIATVVAPVHGFFDRLFGLFRPPPPPGSRPGD